jgi:hypothetical protein
VRPRDIRARARRRRRHRVRAACRDERVIAPDGRVPDGVDAGGCALIAARDPPPVNWDSFSDRRQDRDDQRIQGCLVRRLFIVHRRWRVGRLRRSATNRAEGFGGDTRCRSGRTSCSGRARLRPPLEFERPAGLAEETLVRDQLSQTC